MEPDFASVSANGSGTNVERPYNDVGGDYLTPIKNWKPRHENIVILHLNGWSNIAIAEYIGLTKERVSQIINDPTARKIIDATMKRVRENLADNIEDNLTRLSSLSVERIEETLGTKFPPGTDPKKHQDNVALKLMKGRGLLPGELEKEREGAKIPVSLLERFMDAFEGANEAKRLHSGETEVVAEEEIEDLEDYEIVEVDAVVEEDNE